MNNIEINDKLETDIENKYIKYKENAKFTTEEAIYILKRKDFCDEIENIAIENLIQEYKELKEYKKIAELTKISCCTAQNCEALNNAIKNGLENEKLIQENKELNEKRKDGTLSDGYYTYNDLYYQRCVLFATICNLNKDISWKSKKHSDGKKCFDSDNWFIVGIDTPEGSYTYHYEMKYWDMFNVKELEVGKIWDGHTEKDVTRLLTLVEGE